MSSAQPLAPGTLILCPRCGNRFAVPRADPSQALQAGPSCSPPQAGAGSNAPGDQVMAAGAGSRRLALALVFAGGLLFLGLGQPPGDPACYRYVSGAHTAGLQPVEFADGSVQIRS
jgi:hypothetical protein